MTSVTSPHSDNEKTLFELISNNDHNGLKLHMSQYGIKPNITDEHGMTPLSLAAYKGNLEISQYLLDQVSNVFNTDSFELLKFKLCFRSLFSY